MLEMETRLPPPSDSESATLARRLSSSSSSSSTAVVGAAGEHQPLRAGAREGDDHHDENRARFEAALEGILGADVAPKGSSAHRLYQVFVAYFLHQALHHDKALSAHRLTVTLLGDPTAPAKGRRLKFCMTGEEREPNEFLQSLRTTTSASALSTVGEREDAALPQLTNDKFFAMAATWLGEDLSLALKALLRRVKISFVATRFLGGGKKIWVNWEWVGLLYGGSSAHVLGSDERWNTATIRQQAAAAGPPEYLPAEAGTPEEGGIVGPYSRSEPIVLESALRASVDSRSFLSPASATASAATTYFTTEGDPALSAHQLTAASPYLHGAAESYAFSYPTSLAASQFPACGIDVPFTQPGDLLAATQPPIKEKRSLGKKISRGFHKLTHHHHHHDE